MARPQRGTAALQRLRGIGCQPSSWWIILGEFLVWWVEKPVFAVGVAVGCSFRVGRGECSSFGGFFVGPKGPPTLLRLEEKFVQAPCSHTSHGPETTGPEEALERTGVLLWGNLGSPSNMVGGDIIYSVLSPCGRQVPLHMFPCLGLEEPPYF